MTAAAYYNEHDPHAAQWLRNLIDAGQIAPGVVDERDIRDVRPDELAGYAQCHFFAGIGVWSYALRRAGWPDDRSVWTGSCPCQPFSAAGKGNGFADERHLWPAWQWLIANCRPDTIFGEQVASKDGLNWFDLVLADLEGSGYAVGVSDTCAAGVGAPHIRQRLFFVADAESLGLLGRADDGDAGRRERASGQGCEAGGVGHADRSGLEGHGGHGDDARQPGRIGALADGSASEAGAVGVVADADEHRQPPRRLPIRLWRQDEAAAVEQRACEDVQPGPTNGLWRDADWLICTDGKWRPVEPGTFPLAPRASFDVGSGGPFEGRSRAQMLKGYGNAINAEVATTFIAAFMGDGI